MPHRIRYIGTTYASIHGLEMTVLEVAQYDFKVHPAGQPVIWLPRAECVNIEGQQPLPEAVTGPDMQALVLRDLEARYKIGIERYGQGLKAHDGRHALKDVYEELLDACVYIRKCIYEKDGK